VISDNSLQDFEYERRFFCEKFPEEALAESKPSLYIQGYFLVSDGYNIRIRLVSNNIILNMSDKIDIAKLLENDYDKFDTAFMTVKAPAFQGSRYEAERNIEPVVALELLLRGGQKIVKNRYSLWHSKDRWDIDQFGDLNFGLNIAECERENPVTNLEIPSFCTTEITDDFRFTNDNLSIQPFSTFKDTFLQELKDSGAHFSRDLGTNTFDN